MSKGYLIGGHDSEGNFVISRIPALREVPPLYFWLGQAGDIWRDIQSIAPLAGDLVPVFQWTCSPSVQLIEPAHERDRKSLGV